MPNPVLYVIEVVETKTGEVVKTFGPHLDRMCDRLENGVNINLDHDRFFTRRKQTTDKKRK